MFRDGVNHILDTRGVVPLLEASVKALGHEGVLAIVGVARPGSSLNIDPLEFMMSCKRIFGVIEGSADPALVSVFPPDCWHCSRFFDEADKVVSLTAHSAAGRSVSTREVSCR